MLPWQDHGGIDAIKKRALKMIPDAPWPIESVIFCYPVKRAYGEGEPILVEMKLIGESADHAYFLEVLLPALEKAGSSVDRSQHPPNAVWGRFDIPSIFVARGNRWEPFVENGRLDFHYKPTVTQWSDGLPFTPGSGLRSLRMVKWITPFDLSSPETVRKKRSNERKIDLNEVPSLCDILEAFRRRMNGLSTGKRGASNRFWDLLSEADRQAFEEVLKEASTVQMLHGSFRHVSRLRPGQWIGRQQFSSLPETVLPCLGLASIFHIGAHTHFGCGTLALF